MRTPSTSARGSVRSGSRISSATKFVCCHPPYEKSTGTSAVLIARRMAQNVEGADSTGDAIGGGSVGITATGMNAAAMSSAASAPSLSTVKIFCVAAPGCTPSMLTSESRSTAPSASAVTAPGGRSRIFTAYVAKVTATAAMAPVAMASSSAHP